MPFYKEIVRQRNDASNGLLLVVYRGMTAINSSRHTVRSHKSDMSRSEQWLFVSSLAVGVAFACTGYAVAYAVLWAPVPFSHAERLAVVRDAANPERAGTLDKADVAYLERRTDLFESVSAYHVVTHQLTGARAGNGGADVTGALVTPAMFDVLGTRALVGRTFRPEDGAVRQVPALIASERLIEARGIPSTVGARVYLDGREYELVGVMPAWFWFPNRATRFWIPLPTAETPGATWRGTVLARLAPGRDIREAETGLSGAPAAVASEPRQLRLASYEQDLRRGIREPLLYLQAGAGLVLLLSVLHAAWLHVAAVQRRERDFAIRSAMGASITALVRDQLVASGLLGCLVVPMATLLAWGLLRSLSTGTVVASIPDLESVAGGRLMLATVLTTTVATAASVCPGLVLAARAASSGDLLQRSSRWVPSIATQTFALGLQTGVVIGLATHAVWLFVLLGAVLETNVGLAPSDVHWTQVVRGAGGTSPSARAVAVSLLELTNRLEAAGVSAAVANALPLSPVGWLRTSVRHVPQADRRQYTMVRVTTVTSSYFPLLGLSAREGRLFAPSDRGGRALVVNAAFAQTFFPHRVAVGERIEFGDWMPWTIIGVIPTIGQQQLDEPERPEAYTLYSALPLVSEEKAEYLTRRPYLLTAKGGAGVTARIRNELQHVFPDAHIETPRPFRDLVMASAGPTPLITRVTSLLALAGALLLIGSVVGMWHVRAVGRARDVAVKKALGAAPTTLGCEHLTGVAKLLAVATGIGAITTWILAPLFRPVGSISSRVEAPSLVVVFAFALACAAAVLALASIPVVRRLGAVDPARLLRGD